jgi:hypothetical protein
MLLLQTHYPPAPDFISNFVIINNTPAWINFDEGRVVINETTVHIISQIKKPVIKEFYSFNDRLSK